MKFIANNAWDLPWAAIHIALYDKIIFHKRSLLKPKYCIPDIRKKLIGRKNKQIQNHDKSAKKLSELHPNQKEKFGPNDYLPKTEDMAEYRRNRHHIRPLREPPVNPKRSRQSADKPFLSEENPDSQPNPEVLGRRSSIEHRDSNFRATRSGHIVSRDVIFFENLKKDDNYENYIVEDTGNGIQRQSQNVTIVEVEGEHPAYINSVDESHCQSDIHINGDNSVITLAESSVEMSEMERSSIVFDEPIGDATRRSQRTLKPNNHIFNQDFIYQVMIDTTLYPQTVSEAQNSPYTKQWKEAMD
ncbi:hypothetical protein JTB14_017521 [Gonioctena quinquepunctata]|nr:hypothetical protein JTB14_017521 [Gonioctena quinquepunctata]